MGGMAVFFFIVSGLLSLGMIQNLLAVKRPGFYPPKQMLKKRAGALAGGGGLFFLLGLILSSFH